MLQLLQHWLLLKTQILPVWSIKYFFYVCWFACKYSMGIRLRTKHLRLKQIILVSKKLKDHFGNNQNCNGQVIISFLAFLHTFINVYFENSSFIGPKCLLLGTQIRFNKCPKEIVWGWKKCKQLKLLKYYAITSFLLSKVVLIS